ncbi:hypothetical protein ACFX1Z_038006 [Malus domestica]
MSNGEGAVRFSLPASSTLVIQKGEITKWPVDGSMDAIVNPEKSGCLEVVVHMELYMGLLAQIFCKQALKHPETSKGICSFDHGRTRPGRCRLLMVENIETLLLQAPVSQFVSVNESRVLSQLLSQKLKPTHEDNPIRRCYQKTKYFVLDNWQRVWVMMLWLGIVSGLFEGVKLGSDAIGNGEFERFNRPPTWKSYGCVCCKAKATFAKLWMCLL